MRITEAADVAAVWHRSGQASYPYLPTWQAFTLEQAQRVFDRVIYPHCAIWVGTLDEPDHLPPDIHIFASSKQPWVQLPPGISVLPEYYDRERHWPAESLARRRALQPQIDAYRQSLGRPP